MTEFYLSDPVNMPRACELTGLDEGEIEAIVGRFANHSHRAGQMRGKVKVDRCVVSIRTSFGNKILWWREYDQ